MYTTRSDFMVLHLWLGKSDETIRSLAGFLTHQLTVQHSVDSEDNFHSGR